MTPSPIPPGPSVVSNLVRGGGGIPATDHAGLVPNGDDQFSDHSHFNMSVNQMTHQQQQQQQSQQPYLSNQCRNSMSISNTKGLLNMPGQNNCFLNSAVQVLWHLDIFRRSFRELTGHACMADSCIFCALKELFAQFQYSRETALPPDALRRALAETFFDQRRFQLGFMDDAAECFENILLRIHCHIAHQESEDMCNAGHCIPHQKFAMTIVEQTVCHACGATSEPLPFNQMVHYVSASALCTQARLAKQNGIDAPNAFGNLMKTAGGMGDIRDCPSSCGAKIQIQKTLMNNPEILSVGLVWDSERPTLEHIMDVFDTIGLTIKLQDVFHSVVDKSWAVATTHNLVGVVTYYGKHYSTFFFHSKLGVWIYFDDAAVREIGPHWEQVVEKCRRGHFQPLLLLYADPNGTPVSVGSAPRAITYIPGQRKLTGPNPVADHLKGRLSRSGTPSDLLNNGLTPTPHVTYLNPAESNSNGGSMVEQCTCRNDKRSYEECDVHGTYISRKAVEHVLNFQKLQRQRSLNGSFTSGHGSVGSRNSSSSLESFENNNCSQQQQQQAQQKNNILAGMDCKSKTQVTNPQTGMPVNLPRRRDSGNWSGDRNSASSASSTSLDNPYVFNVPGRRPFYNPGVPGVKNRFHDPTTFTLSDQGYDSFSLSSTDSYPSIGNGSPLRIDNRLGQILENVQLDLPNEAKSKQGSDGNSNKPTILLEDCDKLCAEADVLLMKSNEKEHEGDLPMAALYSDAAAAKARQAMDAPYNNNQSMVSAKMKHSLCVMRSSNIHRRIKEAEAEERRKQKDQQSGLEIHHHRQSSRDSNHSRHSRQSSRDSTKQSSSSLQKSSSGGSRQGSFENFEKLGRTIEIYATLPKKGSKKKSASYEDVLSKNFDDTASFNSKPEPTKKNHDVKIASPQTPTVKAAKKAEISDFFYSKDPPELSGDYWMRQDQIYPPQITKSPLIRTSSGPANLKDAVEPPVKEISPQNKKQHKIRRKLMGGLMRRKNRSLPDLREGQDQSDGGKSSAYDDSEIILGLISPKSRERKMMNVPNNLASDYLSEDNSYGVSRGFHQPHRAFVNRDYLQRPLLMKVTPPKVEIASNDVRVPVTPIHHDTYKGRNTPLDAAYQVKKPEVIYQNQVVHNQLTRQKTLEDSRVNIEPTPNPRCQTTPLHLNRSSMYEGLMSPKVERRLKTPRMSLETAVVANEVQHSIGNSYLHQDNRLKSTNSVDFPPPTNEKNLSKRMPLAASAEELPVANSSFLAELQAKRSQIMESGPDKIKTMEKEGPNQMGNWLDELQKKQQQMKQKDGVNQEERLNHLQNVPSQNQGQNQMQSFDVPDGSYALHHSPSHTSTTPKPPTVQYKQSTEESKAKSVVKDLASRFEHILYIKPQMTQETLVNPQERVPDLINASRCGLPLANTAVNERTSLVPGRMFTLTSSMTQQATHYPAPYSPGATAPIPNGDNFDIRSSPSIAPPRRDPSPMTHLSAHKLSPSPQECDVRRPQRPPDYETAIQRLGLIRDIRSASPLEVSKQEHYNPSQQEPPKKTRGPKKSVTFSDQVVLVACAEDEESDYLPNPLLERVYKQHNMRNDSETDTSRSHTPQTLNRTENEDTVLCNLCHQQRVKIQAVYCPDCSFYVARFSPKK